MTDQQMVKELKDIEAMAAALLSRSSHLRIALEKVVVKKPKECVLSSEVKARIRAKIYKTHMNRKVEKP